MIQKPLYTASESVQTCSEDLCSNLTHNASLQTGVSGVQLWVFVDVWVSVFQSVLLVYVGRLSVDDSQQLLT